MNMQIRVLNSIDEVSAAEWDHLLGSDYPFMKHEFLLALEKSHATGSRFGWIPHHLVLQDGDVLVGAMAMYEKDNSYGEFVFDWSWADAYQRHGIPYYPKLVVAAPYTPATGPRLLVHPEQNKDEIRSTLAQAAVELAKARGVSSLHFLFTTREETDLLQDMGLMRRLGCQYHWHNPGYRDFEDFLDTLSAKKRKNIRQERRKAMEAGAEIEIVPGNQASDEQIAAAEMFYRITFDRKWGTATLNLEFFRQVASSMGEQLLLVLARKSGRYIAGAICYRDDHTFYGRHWGCIEEYPGLHFELCYYQGIEYCIREKLKTFEPGAQGEHKISRGFLPTPTWSAHWIAHPQFRSAIGHFLDQETEGIQDYMQELSEHSPYKTK